MRQIEDRMLQVCYEDRLVGTMVLTADRKAAFEYSDEWLEDGFSISPFSLPLKKQVFVPKKIISAGCLEYLQIVFQMRGEDYY